MGERERFETEEEKMREVWLAVVVVVVVVVLVVVEMDGGLVHGELSYDFYQQSCPQVESVVKWGLAPVFLEDLEATSALLRLLFHDCQVKGCDASILLETALNTTSEMGSDKNFGVGRTEVVGRIKSMVETECPGTVSCADVLVLCAREAVAAAGGPFIRVPLGRRDAPTASLKLADASLPPATASVDTMLGIFAEKGMTVEESVAIVGAHTLGVSHCVSVESNRGKARRWWPAAARRSFEALVRVSCMEGAVDPSKSFLPNDLTPLLFDNQYYRDVVRGRGLLQVDFQMAAHPRTAAVVERYAVDPSAFFRAFSSAFVKLSSSHVLTGNQGRIRRSCSTG